jgi:hypothetical protein
VISVSHLFSQLICRLSQLSTDTSQSKYCQLISFLSPSILFPFAQLIEPGQVCFFLIQVWYAHLLSKLTFLSPAAVYFLYDLSPITVTIKEERRNFLHFLTRLCAVLGGTFAVTGDLIYCFLFYLMPELGIYCRLSCATISCMESGIMKYK